VRSLDHLWGTVGRQHDEFMRERSVLLLPVIARNGEYLLRKPPSLGGGNQGRKPLRVLGVSLEVGILVNGCAGKQANSASSPKTQHSSQGPL